MSYSRQTWPWSLGSTPEPFVILSPLRLSAVKAGVKSRGAEMLGVDAAPVVVVGSNDGLVLAGSETAGADAAGAGGHRAGGASSRGSPLFPSTLVEDGPGVSACAAAELQSRTTASAAMPNKIHRFAAMRDLPAPRLPLEKPKRGREYRKACK